jgi:hypothetical protein
MRKVSSFSIGALAVLLLMLLLIGCGGGRSAPTGSNLKSMPAGRTIDLNQTLAELDALQAPEGVDPAVFASLKDSLRGALINRGKIVLTPSNFAVNDLVEILPDVEPPTVEWSSNFFIADGNIDGAVAISDITPIAMFFGQHPSTNPLAMVADYNRDDVVGVADITPLAQTFGQTTGGFTVEFSDSATGPWTAAGNVLWADALATKNANGFNVWDYQFAPGVLAAGDWYIRVTPFDSDSNPGVADTPVLITVGGGPITDFIVTGMRIIATGTTNTDAGDTANVGTERYVAPAGGGDTAGETAANTVVLLDLEKVKYTWKGNPYNYDDPLPSDLPQATYDGFITELKGFMDYTVESLTTPADPEAWTPSTTQPPTGYEGQVGPNDDLDPPNQDALLFTAHMADNDFTQGSATFDVTVQVDLLVDPNAPIITEFQPAAQPQNKNVLHTVRFNYGADEVGDELPIEVALYDKDTMTVAYTFSPATTVETNDPPAVAGEYTLQRFPGNPTFTTQVRVLVPGSQLAQGVNYVWRITKPGVDGRSSLKKPGGVFTITGPDLFDVNTWPEEEFYQDDVRAPYLYFVPTDPLIRRNPLGHREPPPADPPKFIFDDPTAASDMVKAAGEEFMIIYGSPGPPPEPDSPTMYYKFGTTPPATIAEADGELPLPYRQPHVLGGLAGLIPATPGDVSFSFFSKEGTLLGSVTRILGVMQITRTSPVINDGDFGVRPWGILGDAVTPDFTDKVASRGSSDVVVFTFYNLWLRHDDGTGLPDDQQGTHLILSDTLSGAPLPDLLLKPALMSPDFNGGLCTMTMDVANPDWWQNIVQDIPDGEYNVSVSNAGSGAAVYTPTLIITP